MLEKVCCILDVDGFDVQIYNENSRTYTTEFLVRELGCVKISPDQDYLPKSFRFDLKQKMQQVNLRRESMRTLKYQSKNVIGLPVLPGPREQNCIQYEFLDKVIRDAYDMRRRSDADVVAYKGGGKERKLLEALDIPCLDLQGFGCPSYKDMVKFGRVYSVLRNCGYHTELKAGQLMHCPMAEVIAYRDWYMMNYRRYSSSALSEACQPTGNSSRASSFAPFYSVFLPDAARFRLSRVCASLATILVNSAPRHVHRRQVIRETWGHPSVTRPLGFTVAYGVGKDPSFQRPVDWEAETFGDVYQLPLQDEYKLLPQKILGLLELASSTCGKLPFIVKTDDDVFVNVYALRDLLEDIKDRTEEKNFWCLVWEGMPVIRANHSKWYVSKEKYSDSAYPNYCSGSAYIINSVVTEAILRQSNLTVPLIPAEDVYVTGVLAAQAEVGHVQISSRYAFKSTSEDKIADGQTIFAHLGPGAEDRVEQLWTYLVWKRKQMKNESADGL
ncbi:beta-1,3-galactosyltransferase 2 [Nephila pilipes]|uniref:Hexosyltransferase n=1 Tax=Nephila pilipes TaxID=299642 RepID=A0A8X6QQS9_NEPPI|nr:beta-1,3-galactosyltransferase 2 [Nephila pilipes]